jgi:PAS domain S-box-containing protein
MQSSDIATSVNDLSAFCDVHEFLMSAPVGVFLSTPEGRYICVNSTLASMLGYDSPQDLLASVTDIASQVYVDPAQREEFKRLLAAHGEVVNFESRFRRKDGSIIWVSRAAWAVRDAKGALSRYQGFTTDITRRKQAEEAIAAANARLEALWSVSSLREADLKRISDHILESLTRMTRSEHGFYGFVDETEERMTLHSWSGNAMRDCSVQTKPQHYRFSEAGVWGEAVRRRMPLIINDFSAFHPAKKGLPQGHVPLRNLLVVPFFSQGRIISVAAVANRETDYGPDDVSQINAFLGSVQAVVDRTQSEEELRTSRALFKAIFDNALDVILIADTDGKILDANPAACRLTGYSREEFLALDVFGLTSRTPGFDHQKLWREFMETGNQFGLVGITCKNGLTVTVEYSAVANFLPGMHLAVMRDITERQQSEAALKKHKAMLEHLFESSPEAIAIVDEHDRVLQINKSFSKLYGYTFEESCGKKINDLISYEKHYDESVRYTDQLLKNGQVIVTETVRYNKYKTPIDVALIGYPITSSKGESSALTPFTATSRSANAQRNALLESEARFKALHNASFGGITIHDKGIILDCNQGLSDITGYSVEELIGMNGLLLIAEKSRDLVMKNILSGYEKPYEAIGCARTARNTRCVWRPGTFPTRAAWFAPSNSGTTRSENRPRPN